MKKLILAISFFAITFSGFTQQKPNIIILFPDDMGYGDTSYNGHPSIKTPHLDKLANEGLKMTNYYSGSPACTASRYTLLTGKYPNKSGFGWVLNPDSKRGLHPKELTLAEILKNNGYQTAIFGKWHLGNTKEEYLPLQQGFDNYLGLPYSNDMLPPKWADMPLMKGNDTIATNPNQALLTKQYTNACIQFIKDHQHQPFFAYVTYAMPHVPLYASKSFRNTSARGLYGDVIEELDWSVGQIRHTLENLGLSHNTVIFFLSDNGPWIIKGLKGGSSGLFRDGKGSTWEGGMRVPGIVYWPKTIAPQQSDAVIAAKDILPTVLSLANIESPKELQIDGTDFSYVWKAPTEHKERTLFYYGLNNELFAVRQGPWKLHIITYSQTHQDYFNGTLPLLFHLEIDPSETENVAQENPDIVEHLKAIIQQQLTKDNTYKTYFD